MKLRSALIAWNPGTDEVEVSSLINDVTRSMVTFPPDYRCTGGAIYTDVRALEGDEAARYVMSEFIGLVVRDGVDPKAAHREFSKIEEYRKAIPLDTPGAEE